MSLGSERVPPYWEKGGGLRGGMASRGGSLGLIACLLLLQPKPCEARAAASVHSTTSFPSGLTEAPRENPPLPTKVRTTKRPTTRSPFTMFSLGNLLRVVCGKMKTVSRPRVGVNDTLNLRDTGVAQAAVALLRRVWLSCLWLLGI